MPLRTTTLAYEGYAPPRPAHGHVGSSLLGLRVLLGPLTFQDRGLVLR